MENSIFEDVQPPEMYKMWNPYNFAQVSYLVHFQQV